jgi:hypothetical protein
MNYSGFSETRTRHWEHEHLTVRTGLQHPVGVCDVSSGNRPAMSLITAGRCAAKANASEMRPANSWNPSTQRIPLYLVTKTDPGKSWCRLMAGAGARQLTVADQAPPRREQLKAGLVSQSAYRVKYSGHNATSRVGPDGVPHILGSAINDVVGPSSSNRVHTLTAGDADDIDSLIGQGGHEHSAYRTSGTPHDGSAPLQRPDASEAPGREPGDRQARTVLKAEAVRNGH